jgi:putative transposase
MNIISLLACFRPLVSAVTLRHFSLIVPAILTMTGSITMSGISRWAEKGGSYRTVNRFFAALLPWNELFVTFFETHLFDSTDEYILAGDATTILKSGKQTHGIGRFFREFKAGLSAA